MPRKVIIETDGVRQEFNNNEFMRQFRHMRHHHETENEVKLFTDKSEMVNYVNQLTGIQNVEIFKIEDNLYKVLVTKKVKHEHRCCHEDEHESEEKE
ncbi:MAG: hypothetical protein EP317_05080 [Bacillota bacterium]|nr:MAG: hypothetical protein EP317_05080 [Bacillota bacterium]